MLRKDISRQQESAISRSGLNAANFFQAEAVGVVLPVLNGFLRASGWRYDSIGLATAAAGLGTLLFQTPAGLLTDRIHARRALFAITSLLVGACFVCLPALVHSSPAILATLFTAGALQSFFAPVLAALALSMRGKLRKEYTTYLVGQHQAPQWAIRRRARNGGLLRRLFLQGRPFRPKESRGAAPQLLKQVLESNRPRLPKESQLKICRCVIG